MPDGCPPNAQQMQRLLGCSEQEWCIVEGELYGMAIADKSSDGRMICRRMVREAEEQRALSLHGRKAAKARWGDARPMPADAFRESESPRSRESENQETKSKDFPPVVPPDGGNKTAVAESEPEPKPRERTYCQQVVDLLLSKWAKVYEQTRGQAYPGDVQKGHGVVTGALPRLVKDFPTTKAKAAALTAEQRREFSAKAVKTWAGFLERAETMHKLSAETPGKDARFMLFPDSPARFVGRMPSLSWRDVQAASKRVQDVKEAKRNTERMRHGD